MARFIISQDGTYYDEIFGLEAALDLAKELLSIVPAEYDSTFTVENEEGYLLASVTYRRLIGSLKKRQWGGRYGKDEIDISEESFDATDAVLLLEHKDLLCLKDETYSSDNLGRAITGWTGPGYVHIERAICAYFGVSDIQDITPEALSFARQWANVKPATEEVVTLSVKLHLRVAHGASVSEFIENLDYSVVSNTAGVTVRNTEIVGSK